MKRLLAVPDCDFSDGSQELTLEKAMTKALTHAGAVVFRSSDKQTLYLVVSSSDGANWVLPKGHIERGESPAAAALRELKEEAGVLGELLARLSVQHFKKANEEVAVQYFLVRKVDATEAAEMRTLRWEDEQTAVRLLTFADARTALLEGAAVVRRLESEHEDG